MSSSAQSRERGRSRRFGRGTLVCKERMPCRLSKGRLRIRYEEAGTGFPLLVTPGGGLNSRVSNWPTAVFNATEAFKNDFRCITMDQRNANGGETPARSRRRPLGCLRRRPARADGPPRHPRVLLHGLLHRRLFRREAPRSGRPSASSPPCSARRSGTGPTTRTVMYRSGRITGHPVCSPGGRPEHGAGRKYLHDLYRSDPTLCTACRATLCVTAGRRYWSCPTTPPGTRTRPQSTSHPWRRTPR